MKRYVCTVATGLLLALVSTGTATATIQPPPLPLPGQSGTQETTFGDQSSTQTNEAGVEQKQGNGNVNIAPAIAIFGDAETATYQGNGNTADATVWQSNEASQSQDSTQKQSFDQDGGSCCKPPHGCKPSDPCHPQKGYEWRKPAKSPERYPEKGCCEHGSSQTGEQTATFGDQVSQQSNTAEVTQKQGNENVSYSPALAFGKGKGRESSCYSKCGNSGKTGYGPSFDGDAETKAYQGNGNEATANVGQSNSVDQAQTSYQQQVLDACKGLIYR